MIKCLKHSKLKIQNYLYMNSLSQKIITTLMYYDVMDYPMTSFEIWKYLIRDQEIATSEQERIRLFDIIKQLENEETKKHINQYRGFYFLRGRKDLVEKRIERNKIAEKKFKRVKKIVWLLRFVPYVRMIAVTGRLAMKNTEEKSDLDFLIVLKHGRIFTGRTLVTFLVHAIGKRRHGEKIKDRVCLNFFITDKSLEINFRDLFSASEYHFIWPIFGREIFRQFQQANLWIQNFKENYKVESISNIKMIGDSFSAIVIRKIGEMVFSPRIIEKGLKKWQTERIEKDYRTHLPGSMVEASDNALIFLPEPQGPEIFSRYQENRKTLNI